MGFSDARLAELTSITEQHINSLRNNLNVHPIYKRVDTCSAEFSTQPSYMYSSYEGDGLNTAESEVSSVANPPVASNINIKTNLQKFRNYYCI